jgi:hypothetical protein
MLFIAFDLNCLEKVKYYVGNGFNMYKIIYSGPAVGLYDFRKFPHFISNMDLVENVVAQNGASKEYMHVVNIDGVNISYQNSISKQGALRHAIVTMVGDEHKLSKLEQKILYAAKEFNRDS